MGSVPLKVVASGKIARRLSAILSADIAGYSRLMGDDEAGTLDALKAHQAAVFPLVPRFEGHIIDVAGDGILAEFPSVVAAVQCAVEIQRVMHDANAAVPEARRLSFRIGVHLGDVIFDAERIYGEGINVAARIQAFAPPGGVVVSQPVFEQVRNKVPESFASLGAIALKNIREPVVVWQAVLAWSPAPGAASRARTVLRSKRVRWAVAAFALVALGTSLAWYRSHGPASPSEAGTAAGVRSIAILPFHRIDAKTGEDDYLGVGLADALITRLGGVQALVVRPTSAVLRYNKPDQDPLAAGREQDVDALLEGTIQKGGQRLRLSVRLLRVRDGASLWAAKYDEDFSDVFKLQDSIAEQTTRALLPRLTGEQSERLARRPTQDVRAYDLYLQGRYHFNRLGPENLRKAIAYFDQAVARDPSFALAYAEAGMAYSVLVAIGAESYEAGKAKAAAAADKAIALDESLAEAHGAQAAYRLIAWDIDGVEREVRRVIELNPSIPEAYSMLGYVYQLRGRLQDAVAITWKSVEINPLSPLGRADLSEASYYARDWNAAIAEYERLTAIEPAVVPPFFILGQALERKGDWAGAIAQCEAAIQRSGRAPAILSALGYAHASAGHRKEALDLARELEAGWRKQAVNPTATHLAILYAGIGDRDRAVDWAEKAYAAHDVQALFLGVEPQFDNLRDDPRFVALARKARAAGG